MQHSISCCLYDQFWSNLQYFIDVSGTRTQIMATEDEDLSASVIFLGMVVFSISSAANYEVENSNSSTFKCVVLSRKGVGFISLKGNSRPKLSFYKETYANSAILYRPVRGFSHSFKVLTLFIVLE